jgi:hypothetical protein
MSRVMATVERPRPPETILGSTPLLNAMVAWV